MSISLVLVIVMAVLFACGVYAMLERSLTRVLIGFLLLGNAANLLLLIVMGVPGRAPFYDGGETDAADMSDALPQALTLTAIVITFGISAFLLALIYRSWQLGQADTVIDDADDLNEASNFVRTIESRQGLRVGVPEEAAWRMGWLSDDDLATRAGGLSKSGYGAYLLALLRS